MKTDDFLRGLIMGAISGAIVGILYAPQAGQKTREDLKDKSKEFKRKIRKQSEELSKDIQETYEHANDAIENYKDITIEKRQEMKTELKNFMRRLAEIAEESDNSKRS